MDDTDKFLQPLAQTSARPLGLRVAKAEGVYLYDDEGKKYLDFISGIAVNSVGHRHPKVVQAIQAQLEKYLHIMPYGEFQQNPQLELAEALIALLPPNLNKVFFCNSGAEANEGALKLAKKYTGRTEIVSCYKSYHGSSQGALSVTGNEARKYPFRPLIPDVRFITFNQMQELESVTERTAAVIIEPVQGDAGVIIPQKEYMDALKERCTKTGALLIADEVQTGLGRTGKMFAFEHFGIVPDIITLAKALGGGLPLGAFISSEEIMDSLSKKPPLGHLTTFGGNPLSCAAALACIEVIKKEKLLEEAENKGAIFEDMLYHPKVKELRRIGLMLALDLRNKELVNNVVHNCLENGVITFWFLSNPECVRLAPPLVITQDEIRKGCSQILEALDKF